MRKISLILLLFAAAFSINAQSTFKIGAFTVKKVDVSFGYETDMVNNLSYQYFVNQMPIASQGLFKSADFNPSSLYGGICENPSISLGLTLLHPALPNFEWRNSLALKDERVDAVSYYSPDFYDGEYVTFDSRHDEFTLESSLIYKLPVTKFFNLYGGAGMNIGIVPKNETCVFASLDFNTDDLSFSNVQEINQSVMTEDYGYYSECYSTGAQLNHRVFLQGGFGLKFFNKIELGVDLRYGYGYRAEPGTQVIGTNLISSNLNVRYILNDKVVEDSKLLY